MKDEIQKALCDLKNSIIMLVKENEELRDCVDAQQDTITAANQLIAKLKEDNKQLEQMNNKHFSGKPDWKDAPEWANWLAQDRGSGWFWYEHKPYANKECWLADKGRQLLTYAECWLYTLESRPKEGKQ